MREERKRPRVNNYIKIILILLLIDIITLSFITAIGSYPTLNEFAHFGDGGEYLDYAEKGLINDQDHMHVPLYGWVIFIVRAATLNLIPLEIAGIVTSIIFQILAAIMLYKICLLIKNKNPLFSTLLLILIPTQLIFYGIRVLPDSFTWFLLASAFYFYLKDRGGLMVLSLTIATFAHYIIILFWPFLAYYYYKKRGFLQTYKSLIIFIPFLIFCLMKYFTTGNFFFFSSRIEQSVGGSIIYYPFAAFIHYITNFTSQNAILLFYYGSFFVLSIIAIGICLRNKKYDYLIFSIPIYLFILCLNPTMFAEIVRWIIYSFPMYLFLITKYPLKMSKRLFFYLYYGIISVINYFYMVLVYY